ncbi:methyltransferase, FxLD system [Yinghuangia sp. YIM S10712]|uniref:methyltransferase, FxLD system n=1 Tax=Yinghuangia sp. YIM S10712 TaxID=3436930 RepID=UPI003F531CF3
MRTWHQYAIRFTDPASAEGTAAKHLGPLLEAATTTEQIGQWWFIRKHPYWRLRCQAHDSAAPSQILAALADAGHIEPPTRGIYEPETLAFGGEAAMDAAHTIFHHDSRHLLAYLAVAFPPLGRAETLVLLYSAMLRNARLDWFEQGDVWHRIAQLRPSKTPVTSPQLRTAIRKLLIADTATAPHLVPPEWLAAFHAAGQTLAALASTGELKRGLRAVLAHHFIFAANRAGLPATTQANLAALAVDEIFHQPPQPAGRTTRRVPNPHHTREVHAMTDTLRDNAPADKATTLRNALVDQLMTAGTVATPAVEEALRRVPRECFVPGTPLEHAYADDAVYTKEKNGVRLSAASQPTIVAMMLEQLDVHPGNAVLELGAGTGYNAALLAALTGPGGHVTTIDVDDDLVDGARGHLAAAGTDNVTVICADGALGDPAGGRFDRIIATVGAHEVPAAWLNQLIPTGRLVVPLRLAGAASRSITFTRQNNAWVDEGSEMSVFMPLRGIGDDSRTIIDLTGTDEVTLQTHRDNRPRTDPATLHGVLDTERHMTWTGVHFGSGESFEWLDLWLACNLDNPIMRMNVAAPARERGLVIPMFPIATMATTTADGALAYLTIRRQEPTDPTGPRYEVGVIGHGPGSEELAEHVADLIQVWDHDGYRTRTARFALEDTPAPAEPKNGRFVLARPDHPITVEWR